MGHCVVDRLDALVVILEITRRVASADSVRRFDPQFGFHRHDEPLEHIQHHGIGFGDFFAKIVGHERRKNQRAHSGFNVRCLDLVKHIPCFIHVVDKWQCDAPEFDHIELRKQGIAEHFYRDAGAVGDEESGSSIGHGGSR